MSFHEIQPTEAQQQLAGFGIVDVRTAEEYAGPLGHIQDAQSIPLPELLERTAELPQGRPILLVCRSGGRSAKACQLLSDLGVGPLWNLSGGMIAWNRAGLPTDRTGPETLDGVVAALLAWLVQVTPEGADSACEAVALALEEHGASIAGPTAEALSHALTTLHARLARANPPADLDLVVEALRDWIRQIDASEPSVAASRTARTHPHLKVM